MMSQRSAATGLWRASPALLTEVRRRAMATEFVVLLPGDPKREVEAAVAALEEVERLERQFSIYRPDSDVSRINRLAASEPVAVAAEVIEVLQQSTALAERSGGAFDVTAGPLVECWGFTKRAGRKPTREEIEAARARVGWQLLEIDGHALTVRFRRPGVQINLGAIGKGFALDKVAARLRSAGIRDFLIHGGNSSVLAAGHQQADPSDEQRGWLVGISHPTRPNLRVGGVRLTDQAIGTSGPGKQFFHHRGRRYGHVIDPRTGWPAGDLESLTVVAATAADADALATGLFVDGADRAFAFAQQPENGVGVVAVRASGRQAAVQVQCRGIAPAGWVSQGFDAPAAGE